MTDISGDEDSGGVHVLAPDGATLRRLAGSVLLVGRGDASINVDIRPPAGPGTLTEISAVALEIYVHPTNLAIRVHQRPPGYLIADVVDTFQSRPRRVAARQGEQVLVDGPLVLLALRLGDGTQAVDVPVGDLKFTPTVWTDFPGAGRTRLLRGEPPREQWMRYVVCAHHLWLSDGRESVPTEASTKSEMKQRFVQWPTSSPSEPKRAVAEAMYYYGYDPKRTPPDRFWQAGLETLFEQGWPRPSMVDWVTQTADESGWAPVGLGGKQGPRLTKPDD